MKLKGSFLLIDSANKLSQVGLYMVTFIALMLRVMPFDLSSNPCHIFGVYATCWISEVVLVVDEAAPSTFFVLYLHQLLN
jgi:hypothetical protein